jgi:hypothetical protein
MKLYRLAALFAPVFSLLSLVVTRSALADGTAPKHGPLAGDDQFPSHVFQLTAHQPERVQLAFHFGLNQPILLHGFNAAVDLRYGRLVLTYSPGNGLNDSMALTNTEKAAGMHLVMPYSTGGGIGVLLIDELWVLADVKVHRFDVDLGRERASYETMTIGGELGWRFFVWKGFNIGVVARYWPNVWESDPKGSAFKDTSGRTFVHRPAAQGESGFLGNILIGWAFDL